jgi:hypothetical protein
MKNYLIILSFLFFFYSTNSKIEKFVLITFLYNETNEKRAQEYETCFKKNLVHQSISKIHVIYDPSKDNNNNKILNFLKEKNIQLSYLNDRPTFEYAFNLANTSYPDTKIILANADIFFDESLQLLENISLKNLFLVLTRWDITKNNPRLRQCYDSQDVWIFSTPLKKFNNSTFQLGTIACEGIIQYQARSAGLEVINPSLEIKTFHLHNSNKRNFTLSISDKHSEEIKNGRYLTVPITEFPVNNLEKKLKNKDSEQEQRFLKLFFQTEQKYFEIYNNGESSSSSLCKEFFSEFKNLYKLKNKLKTNNPEIEACKYAVSSWEELIFNEFPFLINSELIDQEVFNNYLIKNTGVYYKYNGFLIDTANIQGKKFWENMCTTVKIRFKKFHKNKT